MLISERLPLIQAIKNAQKVILSTHAQPDGDGLGSQLALYYALRKMGKSPRIINVDPAPKKYDFLDPRHVTEHVARMKAPMEAADLALIFDTNDPLLLPSLWDDLKTHTKRIVFVDHHPPLDRHPIDLREHFIDTSASSTGQMVFDLIKTLEISFDAQIAMPLYASIVFDTNYFRYIRNSPVPHLMAAELLRYDIHPELVHRALFGNHTVSKLKFLGLMLQRVEYEMDGRLACIRVSQKDLQSFGLDFDDSRDIIDFVMNVETIEAAVLFREDGPGAIKLSFRSKGHYNVDFLAQSLGGGGHAYASGALLHASYDDIKQKVLTAFEKLFENQA